MTIPQDRRWLFVAMLLTFPCPIIVLAGFRPLACERPGPSVYEFGRGRVHEPLRIPGRPACRGVRGRQWRVPVIGLPAFSLVGSPRNDFSLQARARGLLIAALLILALLPVYSFDHMDGRPLRRCNRYELHLGSIALSNHAGTSISSGVSRPRPCWGSWRGSCEGCRVSSASSAMRLPRGDRAHSHAGWRGASRRGWNSLSSGGRAWRPGGQRGTAGRLRN